MSEFSKVELPKSVAPSAQVLPTAFMPTTKALLSPRSAPNGWNKIEGTTTFAPSATTLYRYALSLDGVDKLHIWLEDCQNKKQWGSKKLIRKEFVNLTNAISDCEVADYAEFFRDVLDKSTDGASDVPRTFQKVSNNEFQLEISVEYQVLGRPKAATFSFSLEPISLEPIDHLESKVRDLQEQMDGLASAVGGQGFTATAPSTPAEVYQARAVLAKSGDTILWSGGLAGSVNAAREVVHPGTYQVTVVVSHAANVADSMIQLMKGAECVQAVFANSNRGKFASTTLTCVTRLEKNAELTVLCPLDLAETSYITLVRLGN